MSVGYFLRYLCTCCSYWEYKSVLNVQSSIMKWSRPYTPITFLPWCSGFGVDSRPLSMSNQCFALKRVHKGPFFITCNDILQKQVISVLKDNLILWICDLSYSTHQEYEEAKASSLHTFLIFFKWIEVCWGQVLILKYLCVDCLSPILLKHLDQDLGSGLNILLGQNWKSVLD